MTDFSYRRRYETYDNEGYHEPQELTKDAVESDKEPYPRHREHIPHGHTEDDGDDNTSQKSDFYLFHSMTIRKGASRESPSPDG